MANLNSIKTTINGQIRTETAAGGITPTEVSDILDSIINEIRDRGILWVADYTAVLAVDPTDSKQAGNLTNGNVYRHNGTTWVLILEPGAGGGLTQLDTPVLTATVVSDTEIDLDWTNVANESSFKLEWSPNGTTGWTQIGGTIAANTLANSHTGLTAATQYFYRISAIGDGVTYSDSGYGTDDATTAAGGSGYQAETDAFLAVNTGLSTTIKDALDDLVIAAKGIGWSKFKAIWPLVGGSAAAHKWNLKNPADTDPAFRLTFNGSLTHDANGITPGGTTADFANTHFTPDNDFSLANSAAIGYYVRSISGDQQLMGAFVSGTNDDTYQLATYGGSFFGQVGNVPGPFTTPSPCTRLVMANRTGGTTAEVYRDGTLAYSYAAGYDDTCTVPIYLFGRNNAGTNDSAGNVPCSLAFISEGFTSGEVTTWNTAVNAFETAIGRNV